MDWNKEKMNELNQLINECWGNDRAALNAAYLGANWAGGKNSAEIAAKDAQIAELVEALRKIAQIVPTVDAIPESKYDPEENYAYLLRAERIALLALNKYEQ